MRPRDEDPSNGRPRNAGRRLQYATKKIWEGICEPQSPIHQIITITTAMSRKPKLGRKLPEAQNVAYCKSL